MLNGADDLEHNLAVPQMLNIETPCDLAMPHLCIYIQENWKQVFTQNLYMNIQSRIIHSGDKVGST